ncbi:MAG: AEC family transporter [Gammaproteobacteria bacterium]|nr:AEC family transporter [Gammaproteobacteria bacterium]
MLYTLIQMFVLIGLGLAWSWFTPGRIDSAVVRKVLTDIVYFLFLPALVFNVLWKADLGLDSVKIAFAAISGVLAALFVSWLICSRCHKTNPKVTGAILLAASFPNATYLGYPVLTKTLGNWAGPIAIQYDMFACTPLLLTVGILMSAHFGGTGKNPNPLMMLIKVPPLWAAIIATGLNLAGVAPISLFTDLFAMMGSSVIPIMLFAIGLALKQGINEIKHLPTVIPVIAVQLFIMPVVVLGSTYLLNIEGGLRTAVVLEAAMPSMALGVVLCDRYGLNTGIYAAAVTATTFLSLATLPLWYGWLV